MSPTQVLDQLYQITVPTPFPVGPINCYLAIDDPITLIDTGTLHPDTRAAMEAGLSALGVARRDIRRIIITHAHADHYGLAAELVRASGAEVLAHPFSRVTLEGHVRERERRSAFYQQVMIESGVPLAERQRVADGRRGGEKFAEAVKVDRTIDEGDTLHFAGRSWIVYHTPGHAGGLIVLFEPGSRLLLSNDHMLRDISSNPVVEPAPNGGPRPHRLVEYIYHMRRVLEWHPSVAWTAHGEPIYDVQQLVDQRLAFHTRRAERILGLMGDGDKTTYEIALPLFGRLNGVDSFLALSETIGHLEWLEEQGRVTSSRRGEVISWRRDEAD